MYAMAPVAGGGQPRYCGQRAVSAASLLQPSNALGSEKKMARRDRTPLRTRLEVGILEHTKDVWTLNDET